MPYLGQLPRETQDGPKNKTILLDCGSGIDRMGDGRAGAGLTIRECSAKYKAAQSAGTLNNMKWRDFRRAECGKNATAAATPAAAPNEARQAAPAAPALPSGPAIFPTAVDPKYSKESAGKARMHTCVDQYSTNRATNANGGLKWIQRGGGYYSECIKRLKGVG